MNNNIAIIEDKHSMLHQKHGFIKFEYLQEITSNEIDESVNNFFNNYPNIKKIIIPVRLSGDDIDFTGLRFGLHIRLTKSLEDKRLIPIIFVSEQSKEEILGNQVQNKKELTASLLFTKGVKLVTAFAIEETITSFDTIINLQEYKSNVLPRLLLTNQRELGHQLANEWGVFRLAKFAGIELKTVKLPTDLYFKYQFAKSNINTELGETEDDESAKEQCNVLLIDDNADNGWTEILTKIIDSKFNAKFKAISSFEEAKKNSDDDYQKQDVIFLDLRLKPEEDKKSESINTKEFSGYKLLKKIKRINQGIQVIILTASNKAWNMKLLLDAGADGYYVKESPDYNLPDEFSLQNYKTLKSDIENCFSNRYLRQIFQQTRLLKNRLLAKRLPRDSKADNFKRNTLQKLKRASFLSKKENMQEFALFDYLKILENYCNLFTYLDKNLNKAIVYKSLNNLRNRQNPMIIFESSTNNKINSKYRYEKDFYPFLKNKEEKDKQYVNYTKDDTEYEESELVLSFALKLVAVLDIQLNDYSRIRELMELIYIRNNKIAHTGQNFDSSKRPVAKDDIKLVFSIVNELIKNTF